MEHQVIFFRDQHLTADQQKDVRPPLRRAARASGRAGALEGHPEILVIHADEKSKRVAGEDWHSDVSCDPEPPMGSMLHMHELPPVGGDTLFASMYAAYDALSEPMKRFLERLTAVHDGEHVYRGRYGFDDRGKSFPRAEHPVVRTHPVTRRKALFVNRGSPRASSSSRGPRATRCCEMLFRHVETPEFQCRFRWQVELRRLLGQPRASSTTRCGTTTRSAGTATA